MNLKFNTNRMFEDSNKLFLIYLGSYIENE